MVVFCDALNVSIPDSSSYPFEREMHAFLLGQGAEPCGADLYRLPSKGTVKVRKLSGVASWSFMGSALAEIRQRGELDELLSIIGAYPHQVTRLDATLDVAEDAAPILVKVYRKACRGEVRLGRKALTARAISQTMRPALYSGEVQTGSVYLGRRGDARCLLVYDKRNERLDRGALDPGPLTRFELRLDKRSGVTLRDVQEPGPVFWSVVGRQLLPVPDGVGAWEPHAEALALPARTRVPTAARLARACERSAALGALCQLALDLGDGQGLAALQSGVAARYRVVQRTADFRRSSLGSDSMRQTPLVA